MSATVYNKLVRDKIPDILRSKGLKFDYITVSEDMNVVSLLEAKLTEELQEYRNNRDVDEIADLIEVLLSLGERLGTSRDDMMGKVRRKGEERGRFEKGCVLLQVEDAGPRGAQ